MRLSILIPVVLVTVCNAHSKRCEFDLSGLIGTLLPTTVESSPNPIASMYPKSVTGTINGTLAVIPIPYAEARGVIPSQYGILTKQIQETLPGFPVGFYPLMVRSILDHDIEFGGINAVPDFQSVHIFYPFVDLLGDGYSAFAYSPVILVTATNLIALEGSAAYGEHVYPSTFLPPGNAYAFTKNGAKTGEIFSTATTNLSSCPSVATVFKPQSSVGPWPVSYYVNVTNQPIFADPKDNCDQQITFYNSSVSTGKNAPVGLKGDVFVAAPLLGKPKDSFYRGIYALKVDIAFIENNMLQCSSLKGM